MYVNVVVGINGLAGDQDAVALANVLASGHNRFTLAHVRLIEAVASRGSSSAFDVAARDASSGLLERQGSALAQNAEVVSTPATSVGAGRREPRRGSDRGGELSSHRSGTDLRRRRRTLRPAARTVCRGARASRLRKRRRKDRKDRSGLRRD
jgi:hypothetical protein